LGSSTPADDSSDWLLDPNLQIVNTEDTGSLFSFEIQFNNPPPVNLINIHIDYDSKALSVNNKAALETTAYDFGTPVEVIVDEDRGHIEGIFQSPDAISKSGIITKLVFSTRGNPNDTVIRVNYLGCRDKSGNSVTGECSNPSLTTEKACADGEGLWENTVNILTLPSCYINGHYEITGGEPTWVPESTNEEYVWSHSYCSI